MSLMSPLMTKVQLSAELGVSEITVMNYLKKYEDMPRPIKIGARMFWRRDDIEGWLKNFLPQSKSAK